MALASNQTLVTLRLELNKIRAPGAQAQLETMAGRTWEDMGGRAGDPWGLRCHVEPMNQSTHQPGSWSRNHLSQSLSGQALAKALKGNRSVQLLNLESNALGDEGAEARGRVIAAPARNVNFEQEDCNFTNNTYKERNIMKYMYIHVSTCIQS